jgi:hypothetical protein
MNKHIKIILTSLLILTFGSCVTAIRHNQDMAAIKAAEFARLAFIQQNYTGASKLVPPDQQNPAGVEKIKELVTKMHPTSYPTKVTATDYEPLSGQKAMRIYLLGENGNEKFYYGFVMGGTEGEGYAVSEIYRGAEPLSSLGMKQPLPVKRAAGG